MLYYTHHARIFLIFQMLLVAVSADNFTSLYVNAIIGGNNQTAFQCWSVEPKLTISNETGIVGTKSQPLGDLSGIGIDYFNKENVTDWDYHTTLYPSWIVYISGGGYITIKNSSDILLIQPGAVFIANDTAEVAPEGHANFLVPGTTALRMPLTSQVFNYSVVGDGLCVEQWGT